MVCCFSICCGNLCSTLKFAFCAGFKRVETEDVIVFRAVIPGLTAEDLQVQVADTQKNRLLQITGQRIRRKTSTDGTTTTELKCFGEFTKVYKLPENTVVNQVRAEVDQNGVITITVPKSQT